MMMEILLQGGILETVVVAELGKPVVVECRWVVEHEDHSVPGAVLPLAVVAVVVGSVALTARLEISLSVNLKWSKMSTRT